LIPARYILGEAHHNNGTVHHLKSPPMQIMRLQGKEGRQRFSKNKIK
jgi:hypothetical protein